MIYYYYFNAVSISNPIHLCASRVECGCGTTAHEIKTSHNMNTRYQCALFYCAMRQERTNDWSIGVSECVDEWKWVRTQSQRFEVCRANRASNRAEFWFLFSISVAISIQYESHSVLYKARKIRSSITLRSHVIMAVALSDALYIYLAQRQIRSFTIRKFSLVIITQFICIPNTWIHSLIWERRVSSQNFTLLKICRMIRECDDDTKCRWEWREDIW